MSWFSLKEEPRLAEEVEENFRHSKKFSKFGISATTIQDEIDKLHNEVKRIKRAGVSMWNYKEVLPRIFDVVDGAFVVMKEVASKLEELEKKE